MAPENVVDKSGEDSDDKKMIAELQKQIKKLEDGPQQKKIVAIVDFSVLDSAVKILQTTPTGNYPWHEVTTVINMLSNSPRKEVEVPTDAGTPQQGSKEDEKLKVEEAQKKAEEAIEAERQRLKTIKDAGGKEDPETVVKTGDPLEVDPPNDSESKVA